MSIAEARDRGGTVRVENSSISERGEIRKRGGVKDSKFKGRAPKEKKKKKRAKRERKRKETEKKVKPGRGVRSEIRRSRTAKSREVHDLESREWRREGGKGSGEGRRGKWRWRRRRSAGRESIRRASRRRFRV